MPILAIVRIRRCYLTTVAIETHGCKLNQADSQSLTREFERAGYQVLGSDQMTDIYILNTCTVTQAADQKARQALRAARRRNPRALIVSTGCYAQRDPKVLEALPEVDIVLGNTDKDKLVQEIISLRKNALSPCAVGDEQTEKNLHRARAMVKIQEGCNQVCAYCIVPKVRGRVRSIHANALIDQILALEEEGFQEVVLTGTQLGSYGFDIPGASLAGLIELMLNKTTINRIRISSLQPQMLNEHLMELWQDARLCPHFHLPLQSGSNSVLRRMRRQYTTELFSHAVARIRTLITKASITTDVLTGFPGESDEEFEETYNFCESIRFSDMHVFPYSIRPGTSAAHFRNMIDPITKGQHVKLLLDLANSHAQDFRRSLLHQIHTVLWESNSKLDETHWSGLTDNYVRVYTKDKRTLRNTVTQTILLEEHADSLYGLVIN